MKSFLQFIKESVWDKLSGDGVHVDLPEKIQGFEDSAKWHRDLIDKPEHRAHQSPEFHKRVADALQSRANQHKAELARRSMRVVPGGKS